MTAQVQTRRAQNGEQQGAKRRNKVTAFALAGLVATAGVAGVVVTSSAYFTDVKEIGVNQVTLRGVDIEAYSSTENTILTSFDLEELAPLDGATASEFGTAPSRSFDVRNISTSPFDYKVEIVDIEVTQKDGSALPAAESATALTEAAAKGVIKVNAVRALAGATPSYSAAGGKSLTDLTTTPEILADSRLTLEDAAVTTDEAVVGVRFWIEQSDISAWDATRQNKLQNLLVNYKIKLTATQI